MYYKLYIDSVFFIQFVMNLYLLSITGKILKCTATHRRILLGAFLGAGMICLVILFPLGTIRGRLFLGIIPVSMCMMRSVFSIRTWKALIRSSLAMGMVGFFFGSIVTWLLNRLLSKVRGKICIWLILLLGFASYEILLFLIHRSQKIAQNHLKEVCIPLAGGELSIKALLDTGNHLTEPFSGAPVCIISENTAKELQEYFLPEHFHAIPYRSVGKKSGILSAYELPELIIKEPYREIHKKKVIFAICNTGISKDSLYQMILHPELMDN